MGDLPDKPWDVLPLRKLHFVRLGKGGRRA
jgi:hypothetical protein